jgi:hypothetical protein
MPSGGLSARRASCRPTLVSRAVQVPSLPYLFFVVNRRLLCEQIRSLFVRRSVSMSWQMWRLFRILVGQEDLPDDLR